MSQCFASHWDLHAAQRSLLCSLVKLLATCIALPAVWPARKNTKKVKGKYAWVWGVGPWGRLCSALACESGAMCMIECQDVCC